MDENNNPQDEIKQEETLEQTPQAVEVSDEEVTTFRWKVASFLALSSIAVFVLFLLISPFFTYTSKPAIYLYPDKEQKVEVKLDKSIQYINTIPNYHNGWVVMAKPNGIIYDLQPQYTDCKKLPYNEFGFEYSKKACEVNAYPYIFWDGIQLLKPLPQKETGFIVEREQIENFLNDSADLLKMTGNEKAEFISFWAYKMKEKNYDKFKVYFLQNEEVDKYLPIKVSPKPKSSNRVQIVIDKANDDEQIEEQILIPFSREGFTLVEWGGVIK